MTVTSAGPPVGYDGMAGVYRQPLDGPADPHRWCRDWWPCAVTGEDPCSREAAVQGTA